ncbi:MAG: M20/M25/M40 family metallo-hydrolase [Gaiellaceae bacterium]
MYSGRDPVELLRTLIRFDTSNPPGNERACLEYVGGLVAEAGIEHRYLAREPDRPNLIARVPGRGAAPPLLLYGHVDVVPADPGEWAQAPFGGDLVDGEVWGRGALDMKGGVAMLVTALLRIAASEEAPAGDVILALTSDEEAGSHTGMRFLVEEHAERLDGVRYALSEFGGFTQWHGKRRFVPIQVAEKQRCLIRATLRGPGGHAASVVPGSASAKLGRLLSQLASHRLPVHVTPVARLMIEAMAEALPLHERLALRGLLVPALSSRLLGLLGATAQSIVPLLHNTATPTVVRGGNATNVIPTELSVDLDGRVLPGMSPAELVAELEAFAPGLATFELVHQEPAVSSQPDIALIPLLADILRARDPDCVPIPTLLPGYTDARYISKLGIQTYGFLPMQLPPSITTSLIHAANERVPAEAIEFGAGCLIDAIHGYR